MACELREDYPLRKEEALKSQKRKGDAKWVAGSAWSLGYFANSFTLGLAGRNWPLTPLSAVMFNILKQERNQERGNVCYILKIRSEIISGVRSETTSAIRCEIRSEIRGEIRGEIRSDIRIEISS